MSWGVCIHSCRSKVCLTESEGLGQDMRRQCTEPFSGPFPSSSPPSQPFPHSHSFHLGSISPLSSIHLLTFSSVSFLCLVFPCCHDLISVTFVVVIQHIYLQTMFSSFLTKQLLFRNIRFWLLNCLISCVQQMKSRDQRKNRCYCSFKAPSFSLTCTPSGSRNEYLKNACTN